MWINHMRRFMEWRKPLKQSHPSKMEESEPLEADKLRLDVAYNLRVHTS
jgi:hypothetical protein